jgi:VWFA-related protein
MLLSTEVVMSRKYPMPRLRQRLLICALLVLAALAAAPVLSSAQSPAPAPQKPQTPPDQTAPDSGGPTGDNGSIALPKKKEADTPPPAPAEPKFKNPDNAPTYNLRVEVPEVTVDVGVIIDKTHQFVPGLKPGNFKVFEDGVEQKVVGFKRIEAPITVLMLCEFAGSNYTYAFNYDMLNAAWTFASQLHPDDYAALMTYDMRTHIISDFTQDKRQVFEAIRQLMIPGFNERNMFDAVSEGIDRLSRIEGRKYIVLIGSGRDTFSKLTWDQLRKKVAASHDVTIYTVSTGGALRAMTEGRGGMNNSIRDMDYLQADNEMKTIAQMTGGGSYFPRFAGELPDDFGDINKNIRSKYELIYHPTNPKQDGTYRKLRVELVDEEGKPLHFQDEKHRPLKYDIITRDGYRARPEVE